MELSKIKGLGLGNQQELFNNNIKNIEQLLKLLPSSIKFYEKIDIKDLNDDKYISITGTIISPLTTVENQILTFSINSKGENIIIYIKKQHLIKKQLSVGKIMQFNGMYKVNEKILYAETFFAAEIKSKKEYELKNIHTAIVEKFINKGLIIFDNFVDLPLEYNCKLYFNSYKDVLINIHLASNFKDYKKALEDYIYIELFDNLICFYYFIYSTKTYRREELDYHESKMNMVFNDNRLDNDLDIIKKVDEINSIMKSDEYKNILIENINDNNKKYLLTMIISAKVFIKKQVLIITKDAELLYDTINSSLNSYGINIECMKLNSDCLDFNRGKVDVLVSTTANIDSLNTDSIGLVIVEGETFDVSSRLILNNCSCDNLFISNNNIGTYISEMSDKLSIYNFSNNKEDFCTSVYKNYLYRNTYKSYQYLSKEELRKIFMTALTDAECFIETKQFKSSKDNLSYLISKLPKVRKK